MFGGIQAKIKRRKLQYLEHNLEKIERVLSQEYSPNAELAIPKTSKITKRTELPLILNKLGLHGTGVEIGTQRGYFSDEILTKSKLKRLFSVDPWIEFSKEDYQDVANVTQSQQDFVYLQAVLRLKKHKLRSSIMRMPSLEAVEYFKDNSLDFIYIDALHTYEGCKADIESWWPKLKKGGIFAGHDYLDGTNPLFPEDKTIFGVKSAVDEFVKKRKLKSYVTQEDWPTWYIINS